MSIHDRDALTSAKIIPFPVRRPHPAPKRVGETLTERANRLLGQRSPSTDTDPPEAA
jgi:hypothetical protein